MFGKVQKTLTAAITGLLGWFGQVIAANPNHFTVSNSQWLALGVVAAVALGVYAVPNVTDKSSGNG
jgi:hypothetical protein